jgi:hypothetical protein
MRGRKHGYQPLWWIRLRGRKLGCCGWSRYAEHSRRPFEKHEITKQTQFENERIA